MISGHATGQMATALKADVSFPWSRGFACDLQTMPFKQMAFIKRSIS